MSFLARLKESRVYDENAMLLKMRMAIGDTRELCFLSGFREMMVKMR